MRYLPILCVSTLSVAQMLLVPHMCILSFFVVFASLLTVLMECFFVLLYSNVTHLEFSSLCTWNLVEICYVICNTFFRYCTKFYLVTLPRSRSKTIVVSDLENKINNLF